MAGTVVKFILRGAAFVLVLIITGLIGNVIASNDHASTSATQAINFSMFVCAWTWVTVLLGLVSLFASSLAPTIVMLLFDGFAALFTFVDAIVLAAKLRAIDCGDINSQHLPGNWIGFGSGDTTKRCREIQASTVFMWFLWAVLVPLLAFTVMEARGGVGGFGRSRGSSRPAMSQV